ncbi:MAG: hypothetical protein IT330_10860, partial [Anaerolineae bacterium]|nr:hypothetical protein [Anaerolineae bacterium]
LCDNPRGIIGNPEESMYPGVRRLPRLVRLPGDLRGGETCDEFVNNTDLAATVYDLASVDKHDPIDGQSLLPLLRRGEGWKSREYVTCRYGHSLSYIDKKYWLLTDLDWQPREAFDLESDPDCQKDIGAANLKELFTLAWQRILQDAQGELPPYRHIRRLTDALGRDLDEIRRTKNVF